MLVETTRAPDGSSHAVDDLRLDVCLMDPRRSERSRDDDVARLEGGAEVARASVDAIEDVAGELLLVGVLLAVVDSRVDRLEIAAVLRFLDQAGERRTFLHRALDVDSRRERLVLDDDELRAVLRSCVGLGDDDRDRLAGEDDLLTGERLGRAVGSRRREREIGREQDGDDAGNGECSFSVDREDAGVRLGREDRTSVEETVDMWRRRRTASRRSPSRAHRSWAGRRRCTCQSSRSSCARAAALVERAARDRRSEVPSVLDRREVVAEHLQAIRLPRADPLQTRAAPVVHRLP